MLWFIANTMSGHKIDYGTLRDALGYPLHLADLATMQTFACAFQGTGVTAARFTALELVARNPGMRPARLARAMAIETSNLATLLRGLEKLGWLAADESADRRGKELRLTPEGERRMPDLRRRLRRQDRALTVGLTAAERDELTRLLGKLLAGQAPAD